MAGDATAPSRRAVLAATAGVVGMCVAAPAAARRRGSLESVLDLAMAHASTSVLVARNSDILAERYAAGWGPERPREVASVAKSILAVLIAMAASWSR